MLKGYPVGLKGLIREPEPQKKVRPFSGFLKRSERRGVGAIPGTGLETGTRLV